MRILWCGDSPTVDTGFARCTRAACAELHRAGHEVIVLGINESGDPHEYPYSIYPAVSLRDRSRKFFGEDRLPALSARSKPDVIVILQDPWNIPRYVAAFEDLEVERPPTIGWLAVDSKNHPNSSELDALHHVITWTQFAIDELRAGGYTGPSSIVPLGVDTALFRPLDRETSRKGLGVPEGAFIVGVVGRNQPRKRLDLTIACFAEWITRHKIEDAYLLLKVAPTGETGCDIRSVAAYYGPALEGKIRVSEQRAGMGLPDDVMPAIYSAMDVYLTTTQGEGWGLPCMEAMACGVPAIVPDWSALGEWTEDAAVKVPCTSTALTAPLNNFPYTIGGIADREATISALQSLYASEELRAEHSARGLALTARPEYQWANVGVAFREALEAAAADVSGAAVIEPVSERRVNVCVPVLNRYDLLREMLLSLCESTVPPDTVYVIDNGGDAERMAEATKDIDLPLSILTPEPAFGVAQAWNWFIEKTRGEERIITNDDITSAPDSIAKMLACPGELVFPVGIGFSCFLIRDSCVDKIGPFDESLSPGFAYFEDCDFMFRKDAYVDANGEDAVRVVDLPDTGIQHAGSGTQKADYTDAERLEFKRRYYIAQENFIAKWGKLPPGLRRIQCPLAEEAAA